MRVRWRSTRRRPRTSSSAPKNRPQSGVTDDYVRLAVGIEDINDILWDLDQALTVAQGVTTACDNALV